MAVNKVTLEVYLPAAQQTFDVQVPPYARLSQVTALAGKSLTALSGGRYDAATAPMLCDRMSGEILNVNMTVWELGLRNGSRLMLL